MAGTGTTTGIPNLSQANTCGQGFDIYGAFSMASLKVPLFDLGRASTKPFTLLGNDYLIPACVVAVEDTSGYYDAGASETREGLQNSLSAHAGVQLSAGAFSGEMQASFSMAYEQNTQYAYAYRNYYSQLAYVSLADADQYATQEFLGRVANLPASVSPDNIDQFAAFFGEFGVYYVEKVVLGGSLQLSSAVKRAAELSESDLALVMSAQYSALVESGKVDAKVAASQAWQAYTSNVTCTIRATGGDTGALSALTRLDPLAPTSESVGIYDKWVATVDADPAIVDFSLAGIWNVCGDKAKAVREAWESFSDVMHPKLALNTVAATVPWPAPAATPPMVTLSSVPGAIRPAQPPATACGFQVIVLDSRHLGDAQAVVSDAYYTLPAQFVWTGPGGTYGTMCDQIVADLQPYISSQYVLVLISFGLDPNMLPTRNLQQVLRSFGAGPVLDYWSTHCEPGREGPPSSTWTMGGAYVMVGLGASSSGDAVEDYVGASLNRSVPVSTDVFFYQRSYDGTYSLGLGD